MSRRAELDGRQPLGWGSRHLSSVETVRFVPLREIPLFVDVVCLARRSGALAAGRQRNSMYPFCFDDLPVTIHGGVRAGRGNTVVLEIGLAMHRRKLNLDTLTWKMTTWELNSRELQVKSHARDWKAELAGLRCRSELRGELHRQAGQAREEAQERVIRVDPRHG